ncbi:MAG: threonylcarbamoyl-AMP synthase [Candidatus Izimaplasma sp.]|nr:threonylcarbamoyl-AMP synthase [Candidatus Izimaplasma bacterium]
MIISLEKLLEKDLKDEVIVFQTDTVYGVGCIINSEVGVNKIYELKKREKRNPLAVLCSSISQVKEIVHNFELGEQYALSFWPGALTLIYPKKDTVGDYITSGLKTVGVRIPRDDIALKILEKFGPMAVTSLNLSSEPPILKFEDTLKFKDEVDYIVKGSDLSSISSAVYDVVNKKVLRQGTIKLG